MAEKDQIELSIIVPVLNEEKSLKALFDNLFRQQRAAFEVIFCDGGSADESLNIIYNCAAGAFFPVKVVSGAAGRGRQMNAGIGQSRAETLLFLHVDSSFKNPLALRQGLDTLKAEWKRDGDFTAAGRFALRFERGRDVFSTPYLFYETKARLTRVGCIHGDQGFMMAQAFFSDLGGYREDLPILEDEALADAVFARGKWVLLPAEIGTSARRFQEEGLFERQILNALIMNCRAIGWHPFFSESRGIYRQQHECGRLELLPFFDKTAELLREESWRRRFRLWRRTGAYINSNAWQVALLLDVRRWVKGGHLPPVKETPFLGAYDAGMRPWVENAFGRGATTLLAWLWFHCYRFICRWRKFSKRSGKGYS
ncbi:MAG: glycosyltransferase family 2 protein [Desulfuromonadaceae bacterium]|nr:glycosyltransferase family 2 protein [Desulfuromonadaceae bacterium]